MRDGTTVPRRGAPTDGAPTDGAPTDGAARRLVSPGGDGR